MENSEEIKSQEITDPEQKEAEEKEKVIEAAEVTEEKEAIEISQAPLSVEDIVSGAKKVSPGVQRRIDELTRAKYEARREIEYWKEQAQKVKIPSERPIPPLESDFPNPEVCRKARIEYEDKLDAWRRSQDRELAQKIEFDRKFSENYSKFNTKAGAIRMKYPDFDESVNQEIFNMKLINEIYASDFGPEIGYYLSKNPSEALRLNQLSRNEIAKEIGKLEFKFSEAITRKTSQAPPPLNPVKGEDVAKKDPSKMTDVEWYEWNKQERLKKLKLVK
ncbi:MAG: hypothetical protein ACOYWZ_20235 [Bacillota bacterium]